jgi:hypothetical protein
MLTESQTPASRDISSSNMTVRIPSLFTATIVTGTAKATLTSSPRRAYTPSIVLRLSRPYSCEQSVSTAQEIPILGNMPIIHKKYSATDIPDRSAGVSMCPTNIMQIDWAK